MKNYKQSDYALNKHSSGIVYRFSDRIVEVTLEEYLAENPEKTEQDFWELKALSDAIYYQQDRENNKKSRKNISIHSIEEFVDFDSVAIDEQLIEKQEQRLASNAIDYLLRPGVLTERQLRRFKLYVLGGLSLREIAKMEGTSHIAIRNTIQKALAKAAGFINP